MNARRPWEPAHVALLGVLSDSEVARIVGCHPHTARGERLRRGIPAFSPPPAEVAHVRRKRAGMFPWPSDIADAMLGTMPDAALGRLVNRDHGTVADRRRKLGVPSFGRRVTRGVLEALERVAPRSMDTTDIAAAAGCSMNSALKALERLEEAGRVVFVAPGVTRTVARRFKGGSANVWRLA